MSIKKKLLVPYAIGILALCFCVAIAAYFVIDGELDRLAGEEIKRGLAVAEDSVKENCIQLQTLGAVAAKQPAWIAAVKNKDKAAVRALAKDLMQSGGIDVVTVSDSMGTVIARGHSEKAGDNVLNQPNVERAIKGEATGGIESGTVVKLTFRAGYPITSEGKVVGVITLGLDTLSNHKFVDKVKSLTGLEYTIFDGDVRYSTTVTKSGLRTVGTKMDNKAITNLVLERGENFFGNLSVLGNNYKTYYVPLKNSAGKICGMIVSARLNDDIAAAKMKLLFMIGFPVVIVGGVVVTVGYFAIRHFTNSIERVVAALADISQGEGDLTRRLPVESNDEIGRLSQCFNAFVEKIQVTIRLIAENASTLAGASTELTATASQMAQGADASARESAAVAAAAEEMSVNMQSVSGSTDQMSSNVRVVAAAVEELTASIGEIAKSAEQAARVAGEAASLSSNSNMEILELGAAADQIGKVTEVIEEIAEQTNLLALNATIEAARAGESGKGFAVVATEVKELAKQTAAATEDIRRRIEGIQTSTGKTVTAIASISEVIEKVSDVSRTIASAVEEQSITTKEIAKNIAQTSSAAETVARGVSETALAGREISRNIVLVDQAAKQSANGASNTQEAGAELSRLAERLQGMVRQFKA